MQTNPAAEQKNTVKWSNSPWNQFGIWGKRLWWKGLV